MEKKKARLFLIFVILFAIFCFSAVFPNYANRGLDFLNSKILSQIGVSIPKIPQSSFKLGLDLQGGSHLVYEADLSKIEEKNRQDSMDGLRDVIERRINYFGVKEPIVKTEQGGSASFQKRLIVELAGVYNTNEAIRMIGETPYLEFKEEREKFETDELLKKIENGEFVFEDPYFKSTQLTGKYLSKAEIGFSETILEPEVLLEFNSEGEGVFEELTRNNIGKRLAIYIDGILISAPTVKEEISGGKAQISGNFSLKEAKDLVKNLNAGALPVPIKLISQTTVGPTLGKTSLQQSFRATIFGLLAVILFMIVYYRLSGIFSSLSLLVYSLILLAIFKLLPVTLTLAGIGGAILSVGMAVDANVLIFERQKEERRAGESFSRSLSIGFSRAWPSIRDGNLTTIIIALIMFYFGSSFVKGFALTLILGILTSMFSSLFITRMFMTLFIGTKLEKYKRLWS